MGYGFFSHNGSLLPATEATVALDDIAYAYGFGVYETIRIHDGIAYFLVDHLKRLQHSAEEIELEHTFTADSLTQDIQALIAKNQAEDANLKITLTGGRTADDANLYMQLLNPLYPDRKLYTQGAHAITEQYERMYLTAKTLNMLPSYLAYRRAQAAGAYDALLVDRHGKITEGTRTNFFTLQGKTIFTAPESTILSGVMRKAVLRCAQNHGFTIVEAAVALDTVAEYDGAFFTSTSTKIMPIQSIDTHAYRTISADLLELMQYFAEFYAGCNGLLTGNDYLITNVSN